jgi:ribose/xylose/arabinose/galactoside ABC-type transport system permease subunit
MVDPTGSAPGTRRAPISHYVLAGVFAAVATIAVALLVGATNPGDFWLAVGIGAMCTAYPALSLGARIFVSDHTVTRDARGAESVESLWLKQAGAGAFLDVLVATVVGAVVLMVGRFDVPALPALLAVIGLGVVDAGLRYAVIRHRSLR